MCTFLYNKEFGILFLRNTYLNSAMFVVQIIEIPLKLLFANIKPKWKMALRVIT